MLTLDDLCYLLYDVAMAADTQNTQIHLYDDGSGSVGSCDKDLFLFHDEEELVKNAKEFVQVRPRNFRVIKYLNEGGHEVVGELTTDFAVARFLNANTDDHIIFAAYDKGEI